MPDPPVPSPPARTAEARPQPRWRAWLFAAAGVALVVVVARKVDWVQFRTVLVTLRWPWALFGLVMGCLAMLARALRLTWLLGGLQGYGAVWRAVALGYLGKAVLPMGGGELVKMHALTRRMPLPATTVVAGTVLDRLFDVLAVFPLLGLLVGAGARVQIQPPPLAQAALALTGTALAATGVILARRRYRHGRSGTPSRLDRGLDLLTGLLATCKRPAQLSRLALAQLLVTTLDLVSIYGGMQAFAFGPSLGFLVSVKLMVYMMLGSALPLLPGGAGPLQVACLLALQPAGVSSAGAFAYSLVAQVSGLGLACLQGAATLWPESRRQEGAPRRRLRL